MHTFPEEKNRAVCINRGLKAFVNMTWKIDVRLYSSVRGQLPNVVLTNMCLSCWFYLWGSDVICAFILIIICCEISGLWVSQQSAHTFCDMWNVSLLIRRTTTLCYHDALLRLPCKRFGFLFDCLFSRDTSTLQCTHMCTHTHTHTDSYFLLSWCWF